MTSADRTERLVMRFLAERGRETEGVTDATPLLTSGLLDSIDVLNLVLRIEEEFGFVISPMDVSLDQLDSIDKIRRFVTSRSERDG